MLAGTDEDSTGLAFDHARILADGVERARSKIEYSSLATAFCPPEFTVGELRRVYEAVWGVSLDPRNFHRKVTGTPGFLVPPEARRPVRAGVRPSCSGRAGPPCSIRRCCVRKSDTAAYEAPSATAGPLFPTPDRGRARVRVRG